MGIATQGTACHGLAVNGIALRGVANPYPVGTNIVFDALQYLYGGEEDATALDNTTNGRNALYVDSPCITLNGVDQSITGITGLTSSDTVTHLGTATLTAGAETMSATAGTVYNISINGELIYPCCESSGTTISSVCPDLYPDATLNVGSGSATVMWSGTQGQTAYNALNGCSKVLVFDGTSYATPATDYAINYNGDKQATFHIEFFTGDDVSTAQWVFNRGGNSSSSTDYGLFISSTGYFIWCTGPATDTGAWWTLANCPVPQVTTYYDIWLTIDTSTGEKTVKVNGITDSTTYVSKAYTTSVLKIGVRSTDNGVPFYGSLALFDIYDDTVTLDGTGIDPSYSWCASNAYDTTLLDSSDNGNDATLVDVGFLYYPALSDGTDDVEGLGITNKGSIGNKILLPNCSSSLQQPDGYETELGHSSLFYEDDGVTEKTVTYADGLAWVNFTDNTLVNFELVDGVCTWKSSIVFSSDYGWTVARYKTALAKFPNSLGAAPLVPYEVDSGGIGPDGTWYDAGDGVLYLVESE